MRLSRHQKTSSLIWLDCSNIPLSYVFFNDPSDETLIMIDSLIHFFVSLFVVFAMLLHQYYFLWNIIYHPFSCPFDIRIDIKFSLYFPVLSSIFISHDILIFEKRDKDVGVTNISEGFWYTGSTYTLRTGTKKYRLDFLVHPKNGIIF